MPPGGDVLEVQQEGNAASLKFGGHMRNALNVRNDGLLWCDCFDQSFEPPVPSRTERSWIEAVDRCQAPNRRVVLTSGESGHLDFNAALNEGRDLVELTPLAASAVDTRSLDADPKEIHQAAESYRSRSQSSVGCRGCQAQPRTGPVSAVEKCTT